MVKAKNKWVKTTPYGDYHNPKDNNKPRITDDSHYQAICKAIKSGVHHAGSKMMKQLKRWL